MKAIVALSAKGKSTTEKMVSDAGKTLDCSACHHVFSSLKN
jgi:hypothetical protein